MKTQNRKQSFSENSSPEPKSASITKEKLERCRLLSQQQKQDQERLRYCRQLLSRGTSRQVEHRYHQLLQEAPGRLESLSRALLELEEALNPLDAKERVALRAHYAEGLMWEEVCGLLGCGTAQVYRIRSSAMKKLSGGIQQEKNTAESSADPAVNTFSSDRTGD